MTRRIDEEAVLGEYYRFVTIKDCIHFLCREAGCKVRYAWPEELPIDAAGMLELLNHAHSHDTTQTPESSAAAG